MELSSPLGSTGQNLLRTFVSDSDSQHLTIFHEVVDRLLRLRRDDRVQWLRAILEVIERYPEIRRLDRASLVRGIVLNDAWYRIVARFAWRFPGLATALGRLVPIVGARHFARDVPADRPIVFALMHFGPIYFSINVSLRVLQRRRVYILHAGGENGHVVAKYFARIGCIPIVSDPGSLKELERAVLADGRCIVIFCFDHLSGRRRRIVPFLGGRLAAPTGLAYLAETTNALVVPAWWDQTLLGPRLRIGDRCEIRTTLPAADRQNDLTDRMFATLESIVRTKPRQWGEWPRCTGDVDVPRSVR